MAKLTLTLIRAIKECSMDEPTLIAFIQSVDKKPDPITGLVSMMAEDIANIPYKVVREKRTYRTRRMKADA